MSIYSLASLFFDIGLIIFELWITSAFILMVTFLYKLLFTKLLLTTIACIRMPKILLIRQFSDPWGEEYAIKSRQSTTTSIPGVTLLSPSIIGYFFKWKLQFGSHTLFSLPPIKLLSTNSLKLLLVPLINKMSVLQNLTIISASLR